MIAIPLGVGVVGLGVGEQHARAFHADQYCRLRWLYDLVAPRAKALSEELGAGDVAPDFEAILTSEDTHVVSIASFDDAHFKQVVGSLEASKHVFVEKPLCRSLGELRQIKKAWQRKPHLSLASNLVLRAAPLFLWLRDALQGGELGDIYSLEGDYLYGRIHKITGGWRKDVEGYSVMQGGGVHMVDLMLWLTGQKPVSVASVGNGMCTAGTGFRYHDYMASTFQFASGLIGRITANFGCVHRHQHVLRVFGTKATFILDDLGPRLHTSRDPSISAKPVDLSALPASKGDLIPTYVHSILSGRDTRAAAQHEFDVISTCVAADRALFEGTTLAVEYV